ncbi:MAG: hypothetical protein ACK4TA_25790 [Saprospiraceae bacterium]
MGQVDQLQKEMLVKLKNRLPKEKIPSIIKELYELVEENHPLRNSLISIDAQYWEIEEKYLNGIWKEDDHIRERNKLRTILIEYIDHLIQASSILGATKKEVATADEAKEKVFTPEHKSQLVSNVPKKDLPEYSTFTDHRNGQTYKTVELNGLIWMAENLNYNLILRSA